MQSVSRTYCARPLDPKDSDGAYWLYRGPSSCQLFG